LAGPSKQIEQTLPLAFGAKARYARPCRRRIDDAAQHIELDRIAVSPQCGFASLDTGNPISPEVQEQKLRVVVELTREIWGEV
jgi:methionine synthase II (cobalamin-independent)